MNREPMYRLIRLFLLLACLLFCVAGTAAGVSYIKRQSLPPSERESSLSVEQAAENAWKTLFTEKE